MLRYAFWLLILVALSNIVIESLKTLKFTLTATKNTVSYDRYGIFLPRSIYLDKRVSETLVVISEVHKNATVQKCILSSREKLFHTTVNASFEPFVLSRGYNARNRLDYTHMQGKVHCNVTELDISGLSDDLRLTMDIIVVYLFESKEFLLSIDITVPRRTIPKKEKKNGPKLEICTAVWRPSTGILDRNNNKTVQWFKQNLDSADFITIYMDETYENRQIDSFIKSKLESDSVMIKLWHTNATLMLIDDDLGAINDCVYNAASKGTQRVLIIDADEFFTGTYNQSTHHVTENYKWPVFAPECPNNKSLAKYYERFNHFYRGNCKSSHRPWFVTDVDPHSSNTCTTGKCTTIQSHNQTLVAHVRPQLLKDFGLTCADISRNSYALGPMFQCSMR